MPIHIILLYCTTLIILAEEYKLWSSLLCYFLHLPINFSLLEPNILFSTPICLWLLYITCGRSMEIQLISWNCNTEAFTKGNQSPTNSMEPNTSWEVNSHSPMQDSLLCSQEPATGFYHERNESSPYHSNFSMLSRPALGSTQPPIQ
jgi:hypothetical protein